MRLYPGIFHHILRVGLKTFMNLYLNLPYDQEEKLPPGPKVFAVNHPTVWDAFPILSYVKTDFVSTLVEEQVWSFFWPRLAFVLSNQIVLYRSEKSFQTMQDALFVLSKGHSVLIAPEGERTAPSAPARARRGAIRLAVEGRATVIPVGVWIDERNIVMRPVNYEYEKRQYSVDSFFPRFRSDYGVVFGKPIFLDQYFDQYPSLDIYQEVASGLLEQIYALVEKAKALFFS